MTTTNDEEQWARLQGLMSQLALPERRLPDGSFARPRFEIEILPGSDLWQEIDSVTITEDCLRFWNSKTGGEEFRFGRSEVIPRWREIRDERKEPPSWW